VVMMLRAEPYCTTVSREHRGGGRSRRGLYHRCGLPGPQDRRQEVAARRRTALVHADRPRSRRGCIWQK
jgi:hypothetical protein